ncbi:helicase associated domain-containing protein, putative [Eimeria brunetti]|uniref:Helicase associated domain-containing protein, putative n=1 Tax=Eimeria brunetti TaxID=51314 RepID=U6LAL1_9EIME|nr:helicase associated domain-containing protein, putative [Eimeria brunetti]
MADDVSVASAAAAGGPAADVAECPCLNWWKQQHLTILASAESSGVVLLLGGAEGSTALRCSVLLPLLLLQHRWAPPPSRSPWQQQHILVALETSSSADSAAAAAKAWGGGCYASCVTTHKGIIRGSSRNRKECSSPPRVVYLTTRQLLQRLLLQPRLPGCCVAAVEVSLQHSFSTELLLPLLQKVRQRRPALRLLLLLPPAAVQPHWALQLAEFFAAGEDPASPGAAVAPQGALEVLRAAAQQQKGLMLRLKAPRGGRWDVKHQQRGKKSQQQIREQLPSPGSHVSATAPAATLPPRAIDNIELLEVSSSGSSRSSSVVSCISSDEVMVLGVGVAQGRGRHGRHSKRKKTKKDKKRLQQRLRKIQRKLEKVSGSSSSRSTNSGSLLVEETVCVQTDALDASRAPAQFVHDASHAVHPEESSGEEASPGRRANLSPELAAGGGSEATPETSSCPHPLRHFGSTNYSTSEAAATHNKGQASSEALSTARKHLSAISVLSVAPPTKPVAVRYLESPTPNFIRAAAAVGGLLHLLQPPTVAITVALPCCDTPSAAANVHEYLLRFIRAAQHTQLVPPLLLLCLDCAAVSRLVASATEAPSDNSPFDSIFVFMPSRKDVKALTEALQQHLQQLLKQQKQQKQPQECALRTVELVCLAPDLNPPLPPPSSTLRVFISSAVFPPCVSPHVLSVKFVVDCLYTQKTVFDSFLRLNRTCNVPISRPLADLRASLAGRATEGGCCFRLCTADAFAAIYCRGPSPLPAAGGPAHESAYEEFPASALEDIAPLLLRLKSLGMHSLQLLPLLQPPPAAALATAAEHLLELQAVDENGRITKPVGWMMAQGILSPELTRLLLIAADKAFGCSIEAAALCALLSGPPVWQRSALESCGLSSKEATGEGRCPRASAARQRLTLSRALLGAIEGDPLTALNVFNCYVEVKRTEGPAAASSPASATSPPFVIHPSSVLANSRPPFVVYGQAFMRDGCVYMQQVTAIESQWLPEVAGHLYAAKA